MARCAKCGQAIDDEDVERMKLTAEEADDMPKFSEGDVICAQCWHQVLWPESYREWG